MADTAFYRVGNGFGNIIQTTPAYRYLRSIYKRVVVVCSKEYEHFTKCVYGDKDLLVAGHQINNSRHLFKCSSPTTFKKGGKESEVERNLKLVGCESPKKYHKIGFCGYEEASESFDVLICDGYNKRYNKNDWEVKSYPYYWQVASHLSDYGYSVASIGVKGEWIKHTIDRTNIGLKETIGLIKNCKLLISNDTGFYHAANVLGVKNIVIFTMTDTDKNYDKDFHKHSKVIKQGLSCQPCQLNGRKYWVDNYLNCWWACREIIPDIILNEALKCLM